MRMTKILLLLLFFSVRLSAEEVSTLVVNLRNGTSANFCLSEKPRITFSGKYMNIVSSTAVAEFVRTEVSDWQFADKATSVGAVAGDEAAVSIDDDGVVISGLPVGASVNVYSIEGRCVAAARACDDGRCTLSLATLPAGVYIINYNNTTIKYLKK